ncbi:MAG: inositol monophosphatase [Deltaproteobacteria bacterium]|nr:inositol monophosphatase [Deltaproteobacteria bacterium]
MDLDYIKRTGIAAAFNGGRVLRSYVGKDPGVRKKGAIDLVTRADTDSEKVIIETILERFPGHAVLAEESGLRQANRETVQADSRQNGDGCRWIIDPLDGTTNFAHGLGIFSISIAFERDGEIMIGIVLNPISGELFSAVAGEGAFLNDRPISVSAETRLSDSLLATGFPYNLPEVMPELQARLKACMSRAQGIRRLGSAALDLCYLACGRFEGFWEQNLHPWDTAAGVCIAREAGAVVTDFSNRQFTIDKKEILATNSRIHSEMLDLITLKEA